jgi:glutamyl-tRNA synthetase
MSDAVPRPIDPIAPRLRFAPSPTGFFHVGGARTALFNWFIARRTGGTFVLRIEDTDAERNRADWTEGIQSAMKWVGVDWDEGPFFQSERTALYAGAVDRLLSEDKAYFCTCTAEEASARNFEKHGKIGTNMGYDGFCRGRGLSEGAVRFRTPDTGTTIVVDLVRGEPEFENSLIEDVVIRRTNGAFMFLLANVVDDIDMRISHVVRAEEHLPNTPKAVLLWQALTDQPVPVFAHLPVIVNEQRKKLSKRRDKVAVEDYRTQGVLPHAMANYLALLGWNPGEDREILTMQQMIDEFRLEDVHKASAFFDIAKLTAFNAEYVSALSEDEFVEACRPYLTGRLNPINGALPMVASENAEVNLVAAAKMPGAFPPEAFDEGLFRRAIPLIRERVKLLADVSPLVDFLFIEPSIDQTSWDKTMTGAAEPTAVAMLDGLLAVGETVEWAHDPLKSVVEQSGAALGLKLGKAQAPIRVAVTGRTVGPPLFESLELLGRDRTIARLREARGKLA